MNSSHHLVNASILATGVPLAVGLVRLRKKVAICKWLTLLLGAAAINEVAVILANNSSLNSNPFIHLWILVEFTLLSLIYRHMLGKSSLTLWALGFFMVAGIIMEFLVAGPTQYPHLLRNLESLLIIGFSILWFLKNLTGTVSKSLGRSPAFWIASSHLVYFAGSLVLFNMVEYMRTHDYQSLVQAWNFHAVLLILLYIGYTIALLCKETPPKALSRSSGSAG